MYSANQVGTGLQMYYHSGRCPKRQIIVLKCIIHHFADKAAFRELSRNIESEPEFSRNVENFLRRKSGRPNYVV
jgi:hypothetical protein